MGVEPIKVPQTLAYVLASAGNRSGVDFDYLLQTAMRESSLDPQAKARTSSATGLFQFLEGTWLDVMKGQGPRLGYQDYADAITRNSQGNYEVRDPALRAEILDLRKDPEVAADLAAAYTKANGDYLTERFGRRPSPGELYIAHFLGPAGAEKMFTAGLDDPDQIAASLFPRQAAANPAIFYSDGEPRTIRQVYRALVSKHELGSGPEAAFAVQQMVGAPAKPVEDNPVIPSRFAPGSVSFTALFTTEGEGPTGLPVETAPSGEGSAFFTGLYGR